MSQENPGAKNYLPLRRKCLSPLLITSKTDYKIGFTRTETLGYGGDCCDFHLFKK